MDKQDAAPASPSARRGGAARLFKRGCGCGALILVPLAALLFFLPALAGGPVAAAIEDAFAARHQGELVVPELDLAWRTSQRVDGLRLVDPDGAVVARASATLPALVDLLPAAWRWRRGERCELGRVEIDLDLEIATGADGVSNLARALERREAAVPPRDGGGPAQQERKLAHLFDTLVLELALRPSSVTLRDARLGPSAPPIVLKGLEGELSLAPGAPSALALRGTHDLGRPGPLALTARATDPIDTPAGVDFGSVKVELEIEGLPADELIARSGRAELGGALAELLGARIALTAELERAPEGGAKSLRARFECAGANAQVRAGSRDGVLASVPGETFLTASARLSNVLLESLARPYLPEGASLSTLAEGAALEITVGELALPLAADERGDAFARARASAKASLGPLAYTPAGRGSGARLDLSRAELAVELRPGAGPTFELTGALAGGAAKLIAKGELGPQWTSALCAKQWNDLRLNLHLSADDFPTSVVDAWAAQDGLLVDVLGPSLAFELDAPDFSSAGGRVRARLESTLGTIDCAATYREGALVATEPGDHLTARAGLGPLFAERIVGPLLPVLVGLSKPSGAAPLELSVADFVLPLAGDLGRSNAKVGLALGEIRYQLLPGLSELLPGKGALAQRSASIAPFTVQISSGVASYDGLPLVIDGDSYALAGSYDLATKSLDFDVAIPLQNLRGEVGKALDALRSFLPADLAVPLHVGGTPAKPNFSIASDFVEQAAKQALQKGLQKNVENELKKQLDKLLRRDG